MVVSWTSLSFSEARGFISHYTVAYASLRMGQTAGTMTKRVSGMDTDTTIVEGLTPDAEYSVQVSATNGAGTSDLSSAFIVAEYSVDGKTLFTSEACSLHVKPYPSGSDSVNVAGLAVGVAVGVVALALSIVTIAVILIRLKRK
jgi:hypothetical protein